MKRIQDRLRYIRKELKTDRNIVKLGKDVEEYEKDRDRQIKKRLGKIDRQIS